MTNHSAAFTVTSTHFKKLSNRPSLCIQPPSIGPSSLEDIRVLLATSKKTASILSSELIELGARPMYIRTQRITQLSTEELQPLEDAVLRLSSFDIVMLFSEAALNAFITALLSFCLNDTQAASTVLAASEIRLACSPQLAIPVRKYCGLSPHIVIPSLEKEALDAALPQNANIMVLTPVTQLRDVSSANTVVNNLRECGYQVTVLPAYGVSLPTRKSNEAEIGLLMKGNVKGFIIETEDMAVAFTAGMEDEHRKTLSQKLKDGDIVMVGGKGVARAVKMDFNADVVELPELVNEKLFAEILEEEIAIRRKAKVDIWLPDANTSSS